MGIPLPPLPWIDTHLYDCFACYGKSRHDGVDCPECGGTGWHPPIGVKPDERCDDCTRPLWRGGRGPQWFEHDLSGAKRCRFCLIRAAKNRGMLRSVVQRIANRRLAEPDEDAIDLATFVDKGDES